jgi:hypothetical protein
MAQMDAAKVMLSAHDSPAHPWHNNAIALLIRHC